MGAGDPHNPSSLPKILQAARAVRFVQAVNEVFNAPKNMGAVVKKTLQLAPCGMGFRMSKGAAWNGIYSVDTVLGLSKESLGPQDVISQSVDICRCFSPFIRKGPASLSEERALCCCSDHHTTTWSSTEASHRRCQLWQQHPP